MKEIIVTFTDGTMRQYDCTNFNIENNVIEMYDEKDNNRFLVIIPLKTIKEIIVKEQIQKQ